jgi:hypothetical protein
LGVPGTPSCVVPGGRKKTWIPGLPGFGSSAAGTPLSASGSLRRIGSSEASSAGDGRAARRDPKGNSGVLYWAGLCRAQCRGRGWSPCARCPVPVGRRLPRAVGRALNPGGPNWGAGLPTARGAMGPSRGCLQQGAARSPPFAPPLWPGCSHLGATSNSSPLSGLLRSQRTVVGASLQPGWRLRQLRCWLQWTHSGKPSPEEHRSLSVLSHTAQRRGHGDRAPTGPGWLRCQPPDRGRG